MPHLTLEYTANLEDRAPDAQLLLSLHGLLKDVAGIKIENCKSRWRRVDNWVAGTGEEESAFVHLNLRFLEGRRLNLQQAVGAGAIDILRTHFTPVPIGLDLQITVEIEEIRKSTYFKDPPGTLGPPPLSIV